jgi:hypothetical protein
VISTVGENLRHESPVPKIQAREFSRGQGYLPARGRRAPLTSPPRRATHAGRWLAAARAATAQPRPRPLSWPRAYAGGGPWSRIPAFGLSMAGRPPHPIRS